MHRSLPRPRLLWLPLLAVLTSLAFVAQALAQESGPGQPPQFQPPPQGQPPQGGPPNFQPPPGGPGGEHGCPGPGGPGRGGPGQGGPGQGGSGPGQPGPDGGSPPSPPTFRQGDPSGGPGGGPEDSPRGGPGCGPGGDFKSGFLNRVWKFDGEVDGYDDGVLSMTLSKVVNLPRRFRDQDDELVDQDVFVLLGRNTRVFDKEGRRVERVARSEVDKTLDGADRVRVNGKMLRPDKWRKDEDDSPVPTIRAKKVYVLG